MLVSASVLPGPLRIVVLPAVLLAPGYAFMRLLGREVEWRSVAIAVPVSIMLVILSSLVLYVSGIRLERLSLGPTLGAVTALFLAGSYSRELFAGRRGYPRLPIASFAPGQLEDGVDGRERTMSR